MHDKTEQIEVEDTGQRELAGRLLDIKVAALGLLAFVILMYVLARLLFPQGISLNEQSLGAERGTRAGDAGRELSFRSK